MKESSRGARRVRKGAGQGREEESALRFGRPDMLLGDVAFEVGHAGFAEAFGK